MSWFRVCVKSIVVPTVKTLFLEVAGERFSSRIVVRRANTSMRERYASQPHQHISRFRAPKQVRERSDA